MYGNNFPEWEEIRLEDCLAYEQPTSYIVSSTEYSESYSVPVLTAGKTFILGYTNETDGVYSKDLPVIIFDDFTTTSKFVDFPFKVKSSAMKILRANESANTKFMYEAMQRIDFKVGDHSRHWISKYSKLKIAVPSLPEQQKIAEFLTSIDKLIKLKEQQAAKANEWKNGLMQNLLI